MDTPIILLLVIALVFLTGCQAVPADVVFPPGASFSGPLPAASDAQKELAKRLRGHVDVIGGTIGDRNVWNDAGMAATVDYLTRTMAGLGYTVKQQPYDVRGKAVLNLDAEIKGATKPDEIVVIGAHYDSVRGTPAANDNGSGVAAVLEIARAFAAAKPARPAGRTVRFAFFANEEPPFFQTEQMGSLVYARACRARGENVVAMLSLETIGFYSDVKGSQKYPAPFDRFFPAQGDFIAFVGDTASKQLMLDSVAAFRAATSFPSEGIAAPARITGIGFSDQWSFWQAGYPAIMVTDTALFRYPHYHTTADTPDKLDYDRMSRVVEGVTKVCETLSVGG
ncbi:MAG TPA: M28 family peptidase [Tepidisphaeraceae bacterium]|jgi:Zn-dependent M28 family amino/carboxypeptidase